MLPLVKKNKLVSVCSVEHAQASGDSLHYCNTNVNSRTMGMAVSVRTPINQINLLMMEMFPDSKAKEMDATVQCDRLNLMTLCCGADAKADDIPYNFEKEYQAVEQITLSGHVGSIRLAFDLVKYFKKCREFIFIVNDQNVGFPYGRGDTFTGMRQYVDVQSVKIIHDFTIVEKTTLDIQSSTWRLDEFLEGCKECFPNLKKFEVSIHGTGANFDKINRFILGHPHLKNHYSVEINNEKVRTKRKPRALSNSSVHQALLPPPAAATLSGIQEISADRNVLEYISAAQEQRPQDLSLTFPDVNIKNEPQSDEDGENEVERNGRNVGSLSSGNSGVNHYSHLSSQDNVQQYSLPVAPSSSCYRSITYPRIIEEDDEDSRFRTGRNPSPPPSSEPIPFVQSCNGPQGAPGAPPPPIISKNHPDKKKLDDDSRLNGRKVWRRDPRPRRQSSSPPRAPCSRYRSGPRSRTAVKRPRSKSSSPSPRRRRSRYRSPESCRLAPREEHSRRRSRHSDSRRRSMSRRRSRSYSPPYGGYRGGRWTRGYSRGYNGYNPPLRRSRDREVRGFRPRGGRASGFNNTVRGRGEGQ